MSKLAQSVEKATRDMRGSSDEVALDDTAEKPKRGRKAKEPKEPKAPKAPRERKARAATDGIKAAPKLKALLLSSPLSRATVATCIEAALAGQVATLSVEQQREAERLKARLAARA